MGVVWTGSTIYAQISYYSKFIPIHYILIYLLEQELTFMEYIYARTEEFLLRTLQLIV